MVKSNKTSKTKAVKPYSAADLAAVSETPELTDEDFAKAKPFTEAFPALAETLRRTRGPQKAPTKIAVHLRLDRDVVERFRATGKGWQSRINEILKQA